MSGGKQRMQHRDFLVEIGTEELPPKSLATLSQAFADGVAAGLAAAKLEHGEIEKFATPRRLAVRVNSLTVHQPEQQVRRLGPAVAASFDAQGQPTRAALGFAASCGVAIEALAQEDGPKGKVLSFQVVVPGQPSPALLPGIVQAALDKLPIAKRMRWGSGDAEFVRPVHWVSMLLGSVVVEGEVLGVRSGGKTRGHRFHAPKEIPIGSPAAYVDVLRDKGRVLANADERKAVIEDSVTAAAEAIGGQAIIESDLLDEVTALVEWPVALAGSFDAGFLRLPAEVLIATLQDHQRYFPVRDTAGALLPRFVTVANIESRQPDKVREGNERVVRPRLADASFFWDTDRKQSLASRIESLRQVTFQARLGSLHDKMLRVRTLAGELAESVKAGAAAADDMLAASGGALRDNAQRAAELCKCDLLTAMVGEFPELQGTMGRYYAQHDGETAEVCDALEEQYRPRFAGDDLPRTAAGAIVALADKLDTLTGIFAIGQRPTGARDPFGLRRAALGVLRILLEKGLELDLRYFVGRAVELQPTVQTGDARSTDEAASRQKLASDVYDYLLERLRAYYLEWGRATPEVFEAVLANRPASPLDFDLRLQALVELLKLPEAASLVASNKRIANILRKNEAERPATGAGPLGAVDSSLLTESAERALFDSVLAMERAVLPLVSQREYTAALVKLAALQAVLEKFFDGVMVMAEDEAVRGNRLALLTRLRKLFLHVADFSRLAG